MNGPIPLSPLGAAREHFLAERGRAVEPTPDRPTLPSRVVEAARAREGGVEALQLAWELARSAPTVDREGQQSLALLALAVLTARADGSTRISLEPTVLGELLASLGARTTDADAALRLIDTALAGGPGTEAIGRPGDFKPLIRVGGHLYSQRLLRLEDRVVELLGGRLGVGRKVGVDDAPRGVSTATPDRAELERALDELVVRPPYFGVAPVELSVEQRQAIVAAVTRPLSVISGGPGTGKTSIVGSILRLLVRLGVPVEAIALAAPTGKAANRMDGSIRRYLEAIAEPGPADAALLAARPEPRTLHRLLGYSPGSGRFRHHEQNPLAERVVIVDEASMIDLVVMERLVRAVRPGGHLVLLGDADQLPSVDAGAVFRDLLPPDDAGPDDPRGRAAVRLTKSFRMDPTKPEGLAILTVARAIRAGRLAPLLVRAESEEPEAVDGEASRIESHANAEEVRFDRVELVDAASRPSLIERWFELHARALEKLESGRRQIYRRSAGAFTPDDRAELDRLFHHHESFRILCLARGEAGGTGAQAVNETLHRLAGANGSDPIPGEPVLVRRNDYRRGLFNGDQGLVLRVADDGGGPARPMAVFPIASGYEAFPLDALRGDLDLAWAMTVHRSQGSEFDRVMVLLPDEDGPLLTRELLYTAATRARRSVVFVGSRELLALAATRPIRRDSGIGERLAAPAGGRE